MTTEIDFRKKQLDSPAVLTFKDRLKPMWLNEKRILNPKVVNIKQLLTFLYQHILVKYENF